MLTLRARFVVPVDGPVVVDGAVVIDGGRIVAIGPARSVSHGVPIDYEDAVICPGFVNAHTHLELTHWAGRIPPSNDFTDWLRRLMQATSARPPRRRDVQDAVRDGLAQSLRAGVTMIGDVTRFPDWTRAALNDAPPECFSPSCNEPQVSARPDVPRPEPAPPHGSRPTKTAPRMKAVSFGEVISIGTRRGLLEARLSAALDRRPTGEWLQVGVSPHAPYTVEPDALRICAERAARVDARICIHLAETPDERAFTLRREGAFADYLRTLGVWDEDIPVGGLDPVPLARATGVLTPRTVVAHANYLSDADVDVLAASGASVAYCPRTHYAFGHAPHPFREMLDAGINVCIGTDSLASNPSLSILDELRFLRRVRPETAPETLLQLGTRNGAAALGWSGLAGVLRVGLPADLAVIPLGSGAPVRAWADMFAHDRAPVAVYASGVEVGNR